MLHIECAPPVDTGPPSEPNGASATPDGSMLESFVSMTRSCVTCRRRKLKCDRKNPCSRCTKQSIECVYPSTDKLKRKRKTPNSELLTRLGKLEDTLRDWGAHMDDEGILITENPRPEKSSRRGELHRDRSSLLRTDADPMTPSLETGSGVLVVKDGRARYIENQFWARMASEIADLKELVDEPLSEEEDLFDPDRQESDALRHYPAIKNDLLFGSHSSPASSKALYPSPSQIFVLWETYRDNMDPLIKILHRPTVEKLFFDVSSDQNAISPQEETLAFAIFLGAILSLTPEQCVTLLQDSRDNLIRRFRLATEQALTKAELLRTSSLSVLQAFLIFITCMRFHDDIRVIQTLTSVAIHLAQTLGLHKDGTNFGLSAFDTELRRRTWWYLSALESRSLEDTSTNPMFPTGASDTKLPTNINDNDIWPGMTEIPSPREGCTDMTICLMRFELGETWKKLACTEVETAAGGPFWHYAVEKRDKVLSACRKRIEERYLAYFDTDIPLYWMGATISRIVLSKMWLKIHSPFGLPKEAQELKEAETERLFDAAVEIVESWYLLGDDPRAANCRWLFRSYVQWHGMILILLQLCVRPIDAKSDHAWRVINKSYHGRVIQQMDSQSSMLLKPLRGLMAKVQSHRDKQLETQHDGAPPATDSRGVADIKGEQYPGLPSDPHIGAAGAGRGLSGNTHDFAPLQYPTQGIESLSSGFISSTTDQMGWTADDIQAWLATEQEMQQQLDFADWSGWYNSSYLG